MSIDESALYDRCLIDDVTTADKHGDVTTDDKHGDVIIADEHGDVTTADEHGDVTTTQEPFPDLLIGRDADVTGVQQLIDTAGLTNSPESTSIPVPSTSLPLDIPC